MSKLAISNRQLTISNNRLKHEFDELKKHKNIDYVQISPGCFSLSNYKSEVYLHLKNFPFAYPIFSDKKTNVHCVVKTLSPLTNLQTILESYENINITNNEIDSIQYVQIKTSDYGTFVVPTDTSVLMLKKYIKTVYVAETEDVEICVCEKYNDASGKRVKFLSNYEKVSAQLKISVKSTCEKQQE